MTKLSGNDEQIDTENSICDQAKNKNGPRVQTGLIRFTPKLRNKKKGQVKRNL